MGMVGAGKVFVVAALCSLSLPGCGADMLGGDCTSGDTQPCYSGDPATEGVGDCQAGTQTCMAGVWGDCAGEQVPVDETCETSGDEDCDGTANEEGTSCVCVPGTAQACYSGPLGTDGVGLCTAGTQNCLPSGLGFGDCDGEVVPATEVCDNADDEDCNGVAEPC